MLVGRAAQEQDIMASSEPSFLHVTSCHLYTTPGVGTFTFHTKLKPAPSPS